MNERYDSSDIAKALQDGDEETLKKIDIWLNKQFNEQKYKANGPQTQHGIIMWFYKIDG